MTTLTLTDPVNGTVADANTIASNNTAIKGVVNGNIDNANVSASAAIALTKLAFPTSWSTYTPTWASSGTQPVVGNGVITGRYYQIGKLVVVKVNLTPGTTTTFGTGNYTFTLPVTALNTSAEFGSGLAYDSSLNQFFFLTFRVVTTTTVEAYTGQAPANQWGAAQPFVPAVSDLMAFSMSYEAA